MNEDNIFYYYFDSTDVKFKIKTKHILDFNNHILKEKVLYYLKEFNNIKSVWFVTKN